MWAEPWGRQQAKKAAVHTDKECTEEGCEPSWGEGSRGLKMSTLANGGREEKNGISRNGHKKENNVR